MSELRFVRHPRKPEWGPGVVLDDDRKSLTVAFEDKVGPVRLAKKHIAVEDVPSEEVSDNCRLRYLPLKTRTSTRAAAQPTTFPDLLQQFVDQYPDNFQDEAYERNVKEEQLLAARNLLCRENLEPLFEAGDFEGIYAAAQEAAKVSRIVHKYEQNRLASLGAEHIETFSRALWEQLHGEGDPSAAFQAVAGLLADEDAGKWPICTFFLYACDPTTQVYVKPNVVKTIAASVAYEINFDNAPNSRTYGQVCRMYRYLAERLEAVGAHPADNADVQNFWTAATGG